ncbi:Lrp/AsnC family transcriptional regulator [Pigmentiphaga sp.]|uniref:Lrp/AsnC family transcriptional regulator n=1 Tax=Pigmentiphaga sp. TaxID=1977564 RepID=UPI00128E54D0|nr:Lrp/AsnC family transcriptional regulator [Pigmentiphaga sp.]MPS30098.1 Lrp/AsnC family transcriptional regulator [Alcaligenaceae bacterium SAGV5]MPS55212.1 Lrp/AsnC family transcriptional regulator [Alcaligenaceae bacterium SAGV3]MPT59505.1 Lrp/AsnC family transcriptional regulator [Alcaligenaceae bacterium]
MRKNAPTESLDQTDLQLMRHLQEDGRLSNAKLAQRVALSETPCWHRLRKLESEGYIQGYQAMLDRRKLGLGELAFISLNFSPHTAEAFEALEKLVEANDQVLTCHRVTGEADFVMMVVAEDLDSVRDFIDKVLRTLPNVATVRTSLSLREVKFSSKLPLPE